MLSAWATSSRSKKKVKMSYANYDTAVVQAYKCKIIGWCGKFVNPSEIGTIDELRTLRDAWACGSAHWVRLTPSQVNAHMAEVEEKMQRGEVVAKVRKRRSDAGTSRGGKRKAGNKENLQRVAKVKRARTQLAPKSKAVISESDDDADSGENDEDRDEEEDA
jgi:hypothetical protein